MLYLTAAYTGLRLNELKQLVVLDLCLKDENSYIKVRSSTTKNKKDAIIPLHSRLVSEFRVHIQNKEPGEHVFEICGHPDDTFNRDLKRAGIENLMLSTGKSISMRCDTHLLQNLPEVVFRNA
ncbi:tyrosine-type recombinase/integrase [Rubellicoccus peritrichatus]|uniref:Tyrosine-type recombinase/integrase n=1 Tax=Rubellicoccus peritrichatus TaxID=3080537 RepID=A0AAQ3QYF5_9BACT|nr:tyrosine-type recombinase/integrase [Puniceicoccus sp. CR14]WOO43740.1 tyrosine-type recombinase/integrase [Puniceicoccus sp. CR14]